jgi:hypothetical protein
MAAISYDPLAPITATAYRSISDGIGNLAAPRIND